MMGKNHVIVNASITIAGTTCCAALAASSSDAISRMNRGLLSLGFPESLSLNLDKGLLLSFPAYLLAVAIMLWLGSLMPDIDSKDSLLGRHLHLPIKHRTWTHSAWALIIPIFISIYVPVFRFFVIGYGLHIALDAVSAAGVCFWYPFTKYREYPNGAFVARGHFLKLYKAGEKSETWLLVTIVLFCLFLCVISRRGFVYLYQWIRY